MLKQIKFVKYLFVFLACLCFFSGFIFWGDSFSDGNLFSGSGGGKGVIFLIPFVILAALWESILFPEGSITFAFLIISTLFYYMATRYHKKQINYVKVEGPPRIILSKKQLKSSFWGTIISFTIVFLFVLLPVIFVLFVS